MTSIQWGRDLTDELIAWADSVDLVRAMLLTSTRAVPGAQIDILSDFDVILIVREVHPFAHDRSWVEAFGAVLVAYWDPLPDPPVAQLDGCSNVIQYAAGHKIDFTVWSMTQFLEIRTAAVLLDELDAGYRVLLDKDHLTDDLLAPSFRAYLPKKPTEHEFQTHVNDFFSDAPYIAKCLWREELLPAKWALDHDMKQIYLRTMLEWKIASEHGWSARVGALGKGLKKQLPPSLWAAVEASYAGAGMHENWAALFATMAVFRQAACVVAAQLCYTYPEALDEQVTHFVTQIQQLRRDV